MEKLELINISKHYDNEPNIFEDYSITFKKGRFYGIMGHSGVGKSTLLNMIAGLESVDAGDIIADGSRVNEMSEDEKADFRLAHIGFIFQAFYLNPRISVLDNVIVPMIINKAIPRQERKNRASELLKRFGMSEYGAKRSDKLSGGEEQRVAIARALANEPDIILADEPTGNLDRENERAVMACLKELASGERIVIVVSHSNTLREYADEIIELEKQ